MLTLDQVKTLSLSDSPGVYFFKNPKGDILYIGKATSLRDRVRSYFASDMVAARGPIIEQMLAQAASVDVTATDSVLEALILETNLIKKHHPPYNSREKDDKSFNYVVITQEDFPRVLVTRGRNILKSPTAAKIQALYGPFPSGGSLRAAMKIVRRLFPFRDQCTPGSGTPFGGTPFGGKACFNRQIGLCPGVCTGEISKRDYTRQIKHLILFFEGKKSTLLRQLEKEMKAAAKSLEFERAGEIKKTMFSLSHIHDVALIKEEPSAHLMTDSAEARVATPFRIEAYDIAHTSGTHMVGAMVAVENGKPKKSDYKRFKIKTVEGAHDIACLTEVLRRRLRHRDWRLPHLIVVDGSTAQRNAALQALKEFGLEIPVIAVVKNARHRPERLLGPRKFSETYAQDILLANSESHRFALAYHRHLRERLPRNRSPQRSQRPQR